jgi:hypothetical protein
MLSYKTLSFSDFDALSFNDYSVLQFDPYLEALVIVLSAFLAGAIEGMGYTAGATQSGAYPAGAAEGLGYTAGATESGAFYGIAEGDYE